MRPFDRATAFVTVDGGEPISFAEFVRANVVLDDEEVEAIVADLAAGHPHVYGGGAVATSLIARHLPSEDRHRARAALKAPLYRAKTGNDLPREGGDECAIRFASMAADSLLAVCLVIAIVLWVSALTGAIA